VEEKVYGYVRTDENIDYWVWELLGSLQSFERFARCRAVRSRFLWLFLSPPLLGLFCFFVLSPFLLFFLGGSEGYIDPSHVVSTPGALHPHRFLASTIFTKHSALQVECDCLACQRSTFIILYPNTPGCRAPRSATGVIEPRGRTYLDVVLQISILFFGCVLPSNS